MKKFLVAILLAAFSASLWADRGKIRLENYCFDGRVEFKCEVDARWSNLQYRHATGCKISGNLQTVYLKLNGVLRQFSNGIDGNDCAEGLGIEVQIREDCTGVDTRCGFIEI